ncbi:MAG TPA: hypothetical protein VNK04_27210 [Gemmataceae bacterium]|nr:hypothetical protein [Gemmataceae bacterium]
MNRYHAALLAPALLVLAVPAAPQAASTALQPVNLETVNTPKDEDDPFLGSNGLVLYYSSNAAGKFDIMIATRPALTKPWLPGKPLEDYIQTKVDDRSAFVTAEGHYPQFLYFATKKDQKTNNFDIYVSVKQREGVAFAAPTPLNTICTAADELHPWLSADGRDLYFSRRMGDEWHLYVASRSSKGGAAGFGEPRRVKEIPANFHHATLTPDGKTMYLQGPVGKGRWGLFRSSRSGSAWSEPVALEELNSPAAPTGDCSPSLSANGSLLYFSSDRPGGKGGMDLWAIRTAQLPKGK